MKKLILGLMLLMSSLVMAVAPEFTGGTQEMDGNHFHKTAIFDTEKEAKEIFENKVYYFNKYYEIVDFYEFETEQGHAQFALFTGKENKNVYYFVFQMGTGVLYATRATKDCSILKEML